jgi:LEA14-like dessication related protein
MTLTQKVLLLGGAGILVSVLAKAQSAGNLNFYPQSISDIEVSGGAPVITASVRVQNVSNQRLVLRSMAGNVFANNFLIGNGEFFGSFTVQPNSVAILPIQFRLSWLGIVQDIINAFNGNGWKQVIEWTPQVNIEGLPVQSVPLKFTVG